ncbi:MAG TPA: FAD-binding oxidoreductase [Trueperaceae bacterium]
MIPTSDLTTKVETIQRHMDGGVIWPGDSAYDTTRALAFPRVDPRPLAILRPRTPEGVRTAVESLVGEGVPFAVRGGGHSPAALAGGDGVVLIDTRELKSLKLDVAGRQAAAQAGLTAGEYTDAAALHGLATGFGDTPTVGIAGLTLGGGVGFLSRLHGLTIDSLLGAEVVTADGRLVQVGPDAHPDLFWALRGGGGNFGVVTRLDYRLREVPEVYGGTLVLPATADDVYGLVAAALDAPDGLTAIIMVLRAPPVPFLPPEAHGKPIAIVKACFAGARPDGEAAMAPLRASGRPMMDAFDTMPYPRLLEEPPSAPMSARFATGFRDNWDLAAAEAVMAAIDVPALALRTVQLRPLGGAIARVPANATAYAHRDRQLMFNLMAGFGDPVSAGEAEAWLSDTRLALAEGESAFASFLDDWAPGRVPDAYPNGAWERLRRVKHEYDPHNVFRSNHNVPPA